MEALSTEESVKFVPLKEIKHTLGFCKNALAIAILCFWPPDNCAPLPPMTVKYLHREQSWNVNSRFSLFDKIC